MIEIITHNKIDYPLFQASGNAARFVKAFAQEVCLGYGCDIACNRPGWAFVDKEDVPALMVDPALGIDSYDALHLPPGKFDYLHCSHGIEHFENWVDVLDYWYTKLKTGGTLFLYVPDYSQTYWRPFSNRKHIHHFTGNVFKDYLTDRGWKKIFVSGVDANNSFVVMAEK